MSNDLATQAFISDLPDDAPFELWHRRFAALRMIGPAIPWMIGDSLVYAQNRGKEFEDKAIQAGAELGYKTKSLLNMLAVCSRVPKPRRRAELSYSHHATIAYLPNDVGDMLLADAINEDWTVTKLREQVDTFGDKKAATTSVSQPKTDWRDELLAEAVDYIEDTTCECGDRYSQGPHEIDNPKCPATKAADWLKRYRDATQKSG